MTRADEFCFYCGKMHEITRFTVGDIQVRTCPAVSPSSPGVFVDREPTGEGTLARAYREGWRAGAEAMRRLAVSRCESRVNDGGLTCGERDMAFDLSSIISNAPIPDPPEGT